MNRLLMIAVFMLFACCTAFPQKNPKNPPIPKLPPNLMSAKTVFLSVETDASEYHYRQAYKALAEWDRWTVVDDPAKADIILSLSTSNNGTVGLSTATATATATGGTAYGTSTGMLLGIPLHRYHLKVIDPATNNVLWSTELGDQFLKSREAKKPIEKLRKRIEEQERAP
ncbi:MAG TPA: hypothetical protein VEG32_03910 [Clostridia bacterium]|nr:hypothetical protein [Clostridia bacterium]